MAIEFACAGCEKPFCVSEELAGRKGKCSRCGASWRVPEPAAPAAGEIEFYCQGCGKLFRVPENLAGRQGKCSQCGTSWQVPVPRGAAPRLELGPPPQRETKPAGGEPESEPKLDLEPKPQPAPSNGRAALAGAKTAADTAEADKPETKKTEADQADTKKTGADEIEFACRGCGKTYRVSAQLVGKPAKCAMCGTSTTIPRATLASAPPAPSARPATSTTTRQPPAANHQQAEEIDFACAGCGKPFRVSSDMAGKRAKCARCGVVTPIPLPAAEDELGLTADDELDELDEVDELDELDESDLLEDEEDLPLLEEEEELPSLESAGPLDALDDDGFDDAALGLPAAPAATTLPPQGKRKSKPAKPKPPSPPVRQVAMSRLAPQVIGIGEVLGDTFAIFGRHWLRLIPLSLALPVAVFAGGILAQLAMRLVLESLRDAHLSPLVVRLIAFAAIFVTTSSTTIWVLCGYLKACLAAARGAKPGLADLFSCAPQIVSVMLGHLLVLLLNNGVGYGMAFGIGFTLGIVGAPAPAYAIAVFVPIAYMFYMGLSLWPFYLLIIDRKVGAVDSISLSFDIMSGNRLQVFVLGILGLMFLGLGLLALGVGLLAAVPLCLLMQAVAYMKMSGQRVAR